MASWNQIRKMANAFGNAVGRKTGAPNKTSRMVEDSGWRTGGEAFTEGERNGSFIKNKATDIEYQKMYDRLDDDGRAILKEYDMDEERGYGPEHAYQMAVNRADTYDAPQDLEAWRERYGFDISEPAPEPRNIGKRTEMLVDEETDKSLGEELDNAIRKAEGQADYAGRMKGMREGALADDAVDEVVADDYGAQYLEEFKDRLRNGNVVDALRWAAEEYEKYK